MRLPGSPPISLKALAYFYRQLATLEDSGIAPAEGLATIQEQFRSAEFRDILEEILNGVQKGMSISEGMERFPRVFTPLQCSLVHAGETGGTLTDAFSRVADHLEGLARIRDRLVLGLLYPFLVLHIGVLILAVVDLIQAGIGAALLSIVWRLGLLYGVLLVGWIIHGSLRKKVWWDQALMRIPWIGTVRKKFALMKFTRTLGALYGAGVLAADALRHAGDTSGSAAIRLVALQAVELVEGGRTIADAFVASFLFPPLILQMLDVGEKSGRLPETLAKTSEILEDEAKYSVEIMTRILPVAAFLVIAAFFAVEIFTFWLARYPG